MPAPLSGREPGQFEDSVDTELFENSPDCIKILTPDGTIKRLNPGGEIALELDRHDQLDGANWPSLWPGSERPHVEQALADARAGKRSQFLAFCPTAKNTPRWWDVMVTPMPGAGPSLHGLLAVSRDVTELVEAREALVDANERKNQFLTVLSHELRNPLSALGMAVKLLGTTDCDPSRLARIGALMTRQIAHMSRLAEDLLDISRITRGEVHLHLEQFDLRETVQDAAEQLVPMLSLKRQVLRQRTPACPAVVMGDRMRLTQVLGNLIANASRYSPSNRPIDVDLRIEAGFAIVTVTDEGQGIPVELMPRLFETYSQGQPTTDRKSAGVGLGLAIVKGLVDLHGGEIKVESKGRDLGSTFTISLPLNRSKDVPASVGTHS